MIKYTAFTIKANGILNVLITDVVIHVPIIGGNLNVSAIWDTGATNSVITTNVVNGLNLQATGMTIVHTANGVAQQSTYTINIELPNGIIIQDVVVTEANSLSGGCNCLIGMDIIALGDFSITNYQGQTCMSFQVPSFHEIDYVKRINKENGAIIPRQMSLNQPCYCGSGKLYKRCHGKK